MPPKPRPRPLVPPKAIVAALKPLIPVVVKPIVAPVLERLDQHEDLLLSMKTVLDVQFKRIADIQAQLDRLIAINRRVKK